MKNIVFLQFQAEDSFQTLCDIKENSLSYKNSTASVVRGYAIQAGRLMDGLVSRGAHTPIIRTEQSHLRHSRRGLLSSFNGGPNTNGSEFQIILRNHGLFDGVYTVFGQVLPMSMPALDALEDYGVDPQHKREHRDIRIVDCGVISDQEQLVMLLQQSNDDTLPSDATPQQCVEVAVQHEDSLE